jgi:hypothetical protein
MRRADWNSEFVNNFSSRRKADWLTSQSKRLCRVKMTFGNESDALPERERLRISNGNLQRTLCRTAFDCGKKTIY